MAGDEPAPPVGTPAFPPQPAALPALSWLSTAALVAAPALTAPPGRGTPVPDRNAAPTCLAAAPCREATPPAHRWAACFVRCMSSLLFCSYLLFAPGEPANGFLHVGSRLPLSHTFHEHYFDARPPDSLLPSDATRTALDPFLWCHPRKQNRHTRHLVATKVGAVVFATSERKRRSMWMRIEAERSRLPHVRPSRSLLRAPPGTRPRRTVRGRVSRPGRTGCTSRRLTTVGAVHSVRLCSRRRTVTVVTAVGAVSSVGGDRSRCLPHCLLVVLQHLGHGCLHRSAGFLALLAQLTAQSQGGCPG